MNIKIFINRVIFILAVFPLLSFIHGNTNDLAFHGGGGVRFGGGNFGGHDFNGSEWRANNYGNDWRTNNNYYRDRNAYWENAGYYGSDSYVAPYDEDQYQQQDDSSEQNYYYDNQ